tara:strand:- start:3 stop:866 length:864 start_codon:yes stop_codon:yes gene_type:complete
MYHLKKIIKKLVFSNIHLEHLYHYLALKISYERIKESPFGLKNMSNKEVYLELFENAKSINYENVIKYEKHVGFEIDKNWLDDLALLTQVTIKNSELCYAHGRVIYSTLRNYLQSTKERNISILETGTSKGFSSICMAKALSDDNFKGSISSIDIIPSDKEIYWNSVSDFEGKKNRYQMLNKWKKLIDEYILFCEGTSKKILKTLQLERIHFAFLDGSHTYYDVLNEFRFVAKRQKVNDVIIVDDYNKQYKGLVLAANKMSIKYNYSNKIIEANKNRSYLICIKNEN